MWGKLFSRLGSRNIDWRDRRVFNIAVIFHFFSYFQGMLTGFITSLVLQQIITFFQFIIPAVVMILVGTEFV